MKELLWAIIISQAVVAVTLFFFPPLDWEREPVRVVCIPQKIADRVPQNVTDDAKPVRVIQYWRSK